MTELKNKIKTFFRADLLAWITVALVIIPQSMAYAWLAWLPIYIWLYTALVWVIIWWLFWSSKQMSTWPVTIVSIMTAATIWSLWLQSMEQYIIYASMMAFFMWLTYLILSIFRMWIIVEFLSHPVIVWFTNAIALITIIAQAEKIFWFSVTKWLWIFEHTWQIIIKSLDELHLITFLFWFIAILFLLVLKKFLPKIPRVLLLLIISIAVSYQIWFEINYWWSVVGVIPSWLPNINLDFSKEIFLWENTYKVMLFAFIVWLIWFTESIAVAKWVAVKTKQKVSANRELLWQAAANMWSSIFWWYWVAWSFSRTAVNLRAGAETWAASIVTWIIVAITLIYLTPMLYHLPIATLAAIIIIAVSDLIKIEPIIEAWKVQKKDAYVAIITFLATMFTSPNVEMWIATWVILSLAFHIYRSMKPKVIEVSMYKNWIFRDANFFKIKKSKYVSVFRVDWNLFFANAWHFENQILNYISEKPDLKIVIFDFEWVWNIDSSSYVVLRDLDYRLRKQSIKVYYCNLRVKVVNKLHNVGFIESIWKDKVFEKLQDIIEDLKKQNEKRDLDLKPLLKYKAKNKKTEKIWEKMLYKKIT